MTGKELTKELREQLFCGAASGTFASVDSLLKQIERDFEAAEVRRGELTGCMDRERNRAKKAETDLAAEKAKNNELSERLKATTAELIRAQTEKWRLALKEIGREKEPKGVPSSHQRPCQTCVHLWVPDTTEGGESDGKPTA